MPSSGEREGERMVATVWQDPAGLGSLVWECSGWSADVVVVTLIWNVKLYGNFPIGSLENGLLHNSTQPM